MQEESEADSNELKFWKQIFKCWETDKMKKA